MNPLIPTMVKLLPKILPHLIPMADSLVRRPPPQDDIGNRVHELEQAIQILAERSAHLERSIKRTRVLLITTLLLSLGTLITILVR
jgi:hypothetical protein